MSASDPFTFLIDLLWKTLESNNKFAELVKASNRIKLDRNFQPFKESLVEASVPEVTILPVGKRLAEERDCSGQTIIQSLHITIATGIKNTPELFATQWRIFQAIYTAINRDTEALYDEVWDGEKIIHDISYLPLEEGLSYDELNKDLKGWAAILPLDVKLYLTSTQLGLE